MGGSTQRCRCTRRQHRPRPRARRRADVPRSSFPCTRRSPRRRTPHDRTAAAASSPNLFQHAIDAGVDIGQYKLHWLELAGVLIGVASAWYGMKRSVLAWPVGIVANVMLFFVYTAAVFGADGESCSSARPAGRSSSSSRASTAGGAGPGCAAPPGDPSACDRSSLGHNASGCSSLPAGYSAPSSCRRSSVPVEPGPQPLFTPQWWFYWCDAWIFVGSIVATYAMARGWNEFWLAWIAVDLVGVPFGFATGYVPTAVLYTFYGALRALRVLPVGEGVARGAAARHRRPGRRDGRLGMTDDRVSVSIL